MKIDPHSHVPIYLQIADGVREAVAAGIYRPGEPLPSLRQLALAITVNPNTVQKAYDRLAREGLIYSQRGRGLFVSEQGLSAAKSRAERAVRGHMDQAVRAGRAAGMSDEEIGALFADCIETAAPAASDDKATASRGADT